jgi:hypothetical protein
LAEILSDTQRLDVEKASLSGGRISLGQLGSGNPSSSTFLRGDASWDTPIVQSTAAVAAATFVANTSSIANDTATFDGYTLGQVVKALRNAGLLA